MQPRAGCSRIPVGSPANCPRRAAQKQPAGSFDPAGFLFSDRLFAYGMSPATNFGITGPPISAAKRLPSGVKKNSRPPIWLSVS